MHELSLSHAILETALRHADGRRVTSVSLRLGRLRQAVPDSLEFFFGIVAKDTLCDGATLEIEEVAASMRCSSCDAEWDPSGSHFRCPECESIAVKVVQGQEFEVESIVIEEEQFTAAR